MLSLEIAKFKAEFAGLEEEFSQYKDVKLVKKSLEELKKEIKDFEKMRQNIGSVNMKALEIYESVEKKYLELKEKREKLEEEKKEILGMMDEIEGKKKELFMKTFEEVNDRFKEIFTEISTKGSQVYLELEDQENPFNAGMNIKAKISGTKYLDIRSLSGGEKTMTALAFIFAIQEYSPASFYILDEVDAALDKQNSEKLARLIAKYSQRAQYVVISHNDGLISEAQNLYGVSMDEHGISKVVSLKI
jgi:chromosome segregation protein